MSDTSPVQYDVANGVGTITLNRPEAMNSLDIATKVLLRETVRAAAEDAAVRCVVLTGTGRAFCTGQDLKEHIQILESGSSEQLFTTVDEHYNPIVSAIDAMEKPVIAAVNGVAAGAGASLAFACDLRVVADTAGFNLAFANVALSCDTGSSYTLQRLVGRAKALELLYFPRTVKADEALELGLANQVVPADELAGVVADLAARLAAGSDRRARLDPAVGGLRRVAHLRGVARARERDDAEDRSDRGPPGRGRRVRGQGEAGLQRPLARRDAGPGRGRPCRGTRRRSRAPESGRSCASGRGRAWRRTPP